MDFDIVDKLCNLEVQQFETEETYDLIQRADNSTGLHIFGLFDSIRSTIQSGISIFSITLVIWSWNPFVASCTGTVRNCYSQNTDNGVHYRL